MVGILLLALPSGVLAQTPLISWIDKSEYFIIEHVKGYDFMEERGLEHQQFDILVFGDKDRELSFFFTFYQGEKICNRIISRAPAAAFKNDLAEIGVTFTKISNNTWENVDKTIMVTADQVDEMMTIVVRGAK